MPLAAAVTVLVVDGIALYWLFLFHGFLNKLCPGSSVTRDTSSFLVQLRVVLCPLLANFFVVGVTLFFLPQNRVLELSLSEFVCALRRKPFLQRSLASFFSLFVQFDFLPPHFLRELLYLLNVKPVFVLLAFQSGQGVSVLPLFAQLLSIECFFHPLMQSRWGSFFLHAT